MRSPAFVSLLVAITTTSSPARAAEIPCSPVEAGVIGIDGLLEDWSGEPGVDAGDKDADLSFTLKCNYDREALYLVVDVRDDKLVRAGGAAAGKAPKAKKPPKAPKAKTPPKRAGGKRGAAAEIPAAAEDHVELAFADGKRVERLVVYPGDPESGAARKLYWASGRPVENVNVADALQARGWAVELRIARNAIPGFGPGAPSLKTAVGAFDCDDPKHLAIDRTVTTAPLERPERFGTIEFAEARAVIEAFLRDQNLTPKDILFERAGRLLPSGMGRAIVAGRTLAIIGDEYVYVKLPISSPKDILEVRLADLAGDGRDAVLLRYRETVNRGSREVLAAFRLAGEGLHRTFGVEVAKAIGDNRLLTKATFVPRGRATDILVEPLPAVGWTEASFRETPAEDVAPIPLPWGKEKRARFRFHSDDTYVRAD